MSYVIRNGHLEPAKPIKNLTEEQKKVLRIGTSRQREKVLALKTKIAKHGLAE